MLIGVWAARASVVNGRSVPMKSFRGIALLLVSNLLIFLTLSISFSLLINLILPAFGIDLRGSVDARIFLWALVIGFGGAFLSLAMSKFLARQTFPMRRIERPQNSGEQLLFQTVEQLAARLGIAMPELWIYENPEPNAFATGPSRNNSMIAVSTGLLQVLRPEEWRAVLAHEMGHVYNGDMVSTTLLQGLMNTFVFWLAGMARSLLDDRPMVAFAVSLGLQIFLSILALLPITWFSRRREFAADRFAAEQVGAAAMISALQRLEDYSARMQLEHDALHDSMATSYIFGNWHGWFATHPSTADRIAALRALGATPQGLAV